MNNDPEPPGEAEERRELVARALALLEGEFEPGTWQAFQRYVVEGRPPAEVEKTITALRRSPFVLVAAPADCPAQSRGKFCR